MSDLVLCYVNPWCTDLFSEICHGYNPKANVSFVSFFHGCDNTGFTKNFSEKFYSITQEEIDAFKTTRLNEIIARCRLLRSLDNDLAIKYVAVATLCVSDLLDKLKPKLFLAESTDQYLVEILFNECNSRGIECHGFIRTFVNGYYRLSRIGEYNKMREADAGDIKAVEQCLLSPSYLPSNLVMMKKSPLKSYLNIMLRNILRTFVFGLIRSFPKNRFNYHIQATYTVSKNQHLHWIPARRLGYPNWREKLDPTKKTLFFPLQHAPEATIDYWGYDLSIIDYEDFVKKVIERTSRSFNLVIKEHPGVWGYRKPNFYSAFVQNPDVVVAPTDLASNECLKSTDAVLTVTGSIGFEAALRGIPVFVLGAVPYYRPEKSRLIIKLSPDFNKDDILTGLRSIPRELTKEKRLLLEHLTNGVMPGTFRNDGSFDKSCKSHVLEARKLGENMSDV